MKPQDGSAHVHGVSAQPVQSVTSAPMSAADEQAQRVRRYLLTMGFRGVCTVMAILASGWLRWTLVAAAVVLPYFAVVMANAVGPRWGSEVAPVEPGADEVRAIDVAAADDSDRTISGHVLDD